MKLQFEPEQQARDNQVWILKAPDSKKLKVQLIVTEKLRLDLRDATGAAEAPLRYDSKRGFPHTTLTPDQKDKEGHVFQVEIKPYTVEPDHAWRCVTEVNYRGSIRSFITGLEEGCEKLLDEGQSAFVQSHILSKLSQELENASYAPYRPAKAAVRLR